MRRMAALVAAVVFLTMAGWALAREQGKARAVRQDESREAGRKRQAALVAALWPGRVAALTGEPGDRVDWAEADRLYVWMRALFQGTGLSGAVPTAVVLPPDPLAPTAKPDKPSELSPAGKGPEPVGEAKTSVEADLEAEAPEVFAPPEGGFGWPASGRVAASFDPGRNPPRLGLVLGVPDGTPIAAAADGQVVFTGALKGLGRVLILSHGGRRHTVYACLGDLKAAEGDLLPRGAILGQAGFCGPVGKPGVYFELRFREKALNPAEWLAARR